MDLLYNENRVSLPGVKRPGSGVDHTPPSIADAEYGRSKISASAQCLIGTLWGSLYLYSIHITEASRQAAGFIILYTMDSRDSVSYV